MVGRFIADISLVANESSALANVAAAERLEWLVSNLSTNYRVETMDDRTYWVVPVSMIVPGVLNGSQGPLYYPADEVGYYPEAWNGMPIVLDHPVDAQGNPISARHPSVLNKVGVGTVFAAAASGNLGAEAWIDVRKAQRLAPELLIRIKHNQPVEVSTGLFTQNTPGDGEYNGVPYKATARNYKPDHLAILMTKKGACSTSDGCGINVNADQPRDELGRFAETERSSTPSVGYHTTQSEFLESIAKGGLRPNQPFGGIGGKGVYLADKPQWSKEDKHHVDEVALEVSVPKGHKAYDDPDLPGQAFYTKKTIKPEHLSVIDRDSGDRISLQDYLSKRKAAKSQAEVVSKDLGGKADTSQETKTAQDASAKAYKESAKADKSGKRKAHEIASIAHGEAQFSFLKAQKAAADRGDKTRAKEYWDKSVEHLNQRKAHIVKMTTNQTSWRRRAWTALLNALVGQPHSKNTGKFKPVGAGTGRGEVHEGAQRGAMSITAKDRERGRDAMRQLSESGHNPPSWVVDEDIWEKAKTAARSGDYQEGTDQFWAVVAHVYDKMGGGVAGQTNNHDYVLTDAELTTNKAFTSDAERKAAFAHMDEEGGKLSQEAAHRSEIAKKVNKDRQAKEHGKAAEAHAKAAAHHEKAGAKKLAEMHRKAEKEHKAKAGGAAATTNASSDTNPPNVDQPTTPAPGDNDVNRNQIIAWLTVNCSCFKDAADVELLGKLTDAKLVELKTMAENAAKGLTANAATPPAPTPATVPTPAVTTPVQVVTTPVPAVNATPPVANPPTPQEWMAAAPPEVRSVFNTALALQQAQRANLIAHLTANIADANVKAAKVQWLNSQSIEDMQQMAGLVSVASSAPPVGNALPPSYPSYFGANGAPVVGNASGYDAPIPEAHALVPLTNDWKEVAAEHRRKAPQGAA